MNSLRTNAIGLAVGLSALAGFVDAVGFLTLNGSFVSFMSGNSTQLAVHLARGETALLAGLAGLIALFTAGVFFGTIVGRLTHPRRHVTVVLGLVSVLLAAALIAVAAKQPLVSIAFMTLAMGAENAVFQRDGEVVVGLTYMTGTLVKLSQKLAAAFFGGDPLAFVPYLLLWGGLIAGGIGGAVAFAVFGLKCIGIAATWAAGLGIYAFMAQIAINRETK